MTVSRLLAVLWTVAILVACTVPGSGLPDSDFLPFGQDKWAHAGLFFGFGWLWVRALPARPWLVVLAGVGYAVATELWQASLPTGRSGEVLDALADVLGLALGIAAGLWTLRQREGSPTFRADVPAESGT